MTRAIVMHDESALSKSLMNHFFYFQVMAAASSHTHKYSNVSSNQDSEQSEPIYQNQAELRKQLQLLDKREPIYQNLPAHEKLVLLQEKAAKQVQEGDDEDTSSTSTTKIKGHVSRVAITNSREDLSQHSEYVNHQEKQEEVLDNNRKKSVTKINIMPPPTSQETTEAVVEDLPNKSTKINKSPPKKPARAKASQSVENITSISDDTLLDMDNTVNSGHLTPSSNKANTMHTPRTPSSKPRAGRKRWAFNFGGSKTGSLKSLKSVKSSGEDEEDKK